MSRLGKRRPSAGLYGFALILLIKYLKISAHVHIRTTLVNRSRRLAGGAGVQQKSARAFPEDDCMGLMVKSTVYDF